MMEMELVFETLNFYKSLDAARLPKTFTQQAVTPHKINRINLSLSGTNFSHSPTDKVIFLRYSQGTYESGE